MDDGKIPTPIPEIQTWLRKAGLGRFYPRFHERGITVAQFLNLDLEDFEGLGVRSPADRKRLMDAVEERRREIGCKISASINGGGSQEVRSASKIEASERLTMKEAKTRRSRIKVRGRVSLGGIFLRSAVTKKIPLDSGNAVEADNWISERVVSENHGRKIGTVVKTCIGDLGEKQSAAASSPKSSGPKVYVCVRKRPLSRKEKAADHKDIVSTKAPRTLHVHELKTKVDLTKYVETHNFQFDAVFSESADNETVYAQTARPLVDVLFGGGRATCFAYGQTGAGKTYTMQGSGFGDDTEPGLYALAVQDIFDRLAVSAEASDGGSEESLCLFASFYEIYGSTLHDLLDDRAILACREDGNNEVQIVGLTARRCTSPLEVFESIAEASQCRSTGVTGANDDSSRSHAVFQVELRRVQGEASSLSPDENLIRERILGSDGDSMRKATGVEIGRLCFIDLAGSERGGDTAANNRATRMEGAEINKSLLALKECIRAMDQKKEHTPFRGSKLTQVLKASFTGKNSKTVMIANVSPSSANVEHTLNTLRYADRVKEMRGDRSGVSRKENEMWSGQGKRRKVSTLAQERTMSKSNPRESLTGNDISVLRKMNSGHRPRQEKKQVGLRTRSRPHLRAPLPRGPRTRSQTKRELQMESEVTAQPKRRSRKSCIARLPRTKGSLARSPPREEDELADAKMRLAKIKAMAYMDSPRSSYSSINGSVAKKRNRKIKSEEEGPNAEVDHLDSPEIDNQGADDLLFSHTIDQSTTETRQKASSFHSASSASSSKKHCFEFKGASENVTAIDSGTPKELSVESQLLTADTAKNLPNKSDPLLQNKSVTTRISKRSLKGIEPSVDEESSYDLTKDADVQKKFESSPQKDFSDIALPETSPLSSASEQRKGLIQPVGKISPKRNKKEFLQTVVDKHRDEINEMMQLVKTNVILLEQIENGELSKNAYATKLELNLAQQMDLILSLKQVAAKLWECERRQDRDTELSDTV